MQRATHVLKNLFYVAFILAFAYFIVFTIKLQLGTTNRNNQAINPKPSQRICAPTPQLSIKDGEPKTPTPKPDEFGTVPKPAPSVTPLPISKTTDLATDLSDKDKVYVYVTNLAL